MDGVGRLPDLGSMQRFNSLRTWRGAGIALAMLIAGLPDSSLAQDAPPGPPLASGPATPAPPEAENSGQDPTRPVTRVDLRLKYQDNPNGFESQLLTLRGDMPILLGGGWKLGTRLDLPLVRTNTITPENLDGSYQVGLGDVLMQGLIISPPQGRAAFAFGTQLIIPTGTDDQFTTGKWQLGPTVAAVYQLPEVSRGSFVALLLRDTFSFAGDDDRPDINVFSVSPIFNWALPRRWFMTFGPEIKFNTRDDWRIFVPFDVTVGRKINPTTVMSLQFDVGLVNDFRQYDWQAEFRVGFFF